MEDGSQGLGPGTLVLFAYPLKVSVPSSVRAHQQLRFFMKFVATFGQPEEKYLCVSEAPIPSDILTAPNVHWLVAGDSLPASDAAALWKAGLDYAAAQPGGLKYFAHYAFLTPSAKGPYHTDWVNVFTSLLTATIKAVGLAFFCPDHINQTSGSSNNTTGSDVPHLHLQSAVWVTDQVGLEVLQAAGVFAAAESTLGATIVSALHHKGYQASSIQNHLKGSGECIEYAGGRDAPANATKIPTVRSYPFSVDSVHPSPNVLLVMPTTKRVYSAFQSLMLSRALQALGCLVEVAVGEAGALGERFVDAHVPVHELGGPVAAIPAKVGTLARSAFRYDLVIWTTMAFMTEAAARAVPTATTALWLQEDPEELEAVVASPVRLAQATAALWHFSYFCVCDRSTLAALFPWLRTGGLWTLSFCTLPGVFRAPLPRPVGPASESRPFVISSSRIHALSRHKLLVRAVCLVARRPDLQHRIAFTVLDGCQDPDMCRQLRTEMDLCQSGRVSFSINGDRVQEAIAHSDLYLFAADSDSPAPDLFGALQAAVAILAVPMRKPLPKGLALEVITAPSPLPWAQAIHRHLLARMDGAVQAPHRQHQVTKDTVSALFSAASRGTPLPLEAQFPLRCPLMNSPNSSNPSARLAIVVHLGFKPPQLLQGMVQAILDAKVSTHLWVTVSLPDHLDVLNTMARPPLCRIIPLLVQERGKDVGPFLAAAWHIVRCKYTYTYLLKFHFMSLDYTRFVTARQMSAALGRLLFSPRLKAVIPEGVLIRKGDQNLIGDNSWGLARLNATLHLPELRSFGAGTVFLARADVVLRFLASPALIGEHYAALPGSGAVDLQWYSRQSGMGALGTDCVRRDVLDHHWGMGGHQKFKLNQGDGLLHHAWERAFGAMFEDQILEIDDRFQCHIRHPAAYEIPSSPLGSQDLSSQLDHMMGHMVFVYESCVVPPRPTVVLPKLVVPGEVPRNVSFGEVFQASNFTESVARWGLRVVEGHAGHSAYPFPLLSPSAERRFFDFLGPQLANSSLLDTFNRALVPVPVLQQHAHAIMLQLGGAYGCIHALTEAEAPNWHDPSLSDLIAGIEAHPELLGTPKVFVSVGTRISTREEATLERGLPWGAQIVRTTVQNRLPDLTQAVVDQMVCQNASWFVGYGRSRFTMKVVELRHAHGHDEWYRACPFVPVVKQKWLSSPKAPLSQCDSPHTIHPMNTTVRPIVFWHIGSVPGADTRLNEIMQRQFSLLNSSGLLQVSEVLVGLAGSFSPLSWKIVTQMLAHPNIRIVSRGQLHQHECLTTHMLWDYAQMFCGTRGSHSCDRPVLYFHSRGVTHAEPPAHDWTKMMEYFMIEHWRVPDFLIRNRHVQTAGCELFFWPHSPRPVWHYSGNFWWASLGHIAKLPDPNDYARSVGGPHTRYACGEFWLLARMSDPKQHVILHYTGPSPGGQGMIHSYVDRYPRPMYDCPQPSPIKELAVVPSASPCSPIRSCHGEGCDRNIATDQQNRVHQQQKESRDVRLRHF